MVELSYSKIICFHSDHQALKFLNSQKNISKIHARCVVFLQKFTYVFKHKADQYNKVVDALNYWDTLLVTLTTELISFEHLLDQYAIDGDFGDLWHKCKIFDMISIFKKDISLKLTDYIFLNLPLDKNS